MSSARESISFDCSECGARITCGAANAGGTVQCGACLEVVHSPGESLDDLDDPVLLRRVVDPGPAVDAREHRTAPAVTFALALGASAGWVGLVLATGRGLSLLAPVIGAAVGIAGRSAGAFGPEAALQAALATLLAVVVRTLALLVLFGVLAPGPGLVVLAGLGCVVAGLALSPRAPGPGDGGEG